MLVLKIGLVLLLAAWGLPGIAAAVVAAECLRLSLGMRLVGQLLGVASARLWWQVALFATMGLAVSLIVGAAAMLSAAAALPLFARVLIETVAGAAVLGSGVLLLLQRFPAYAPLQRFEAVRRWHARVLDTLHMKVSHP